AKRMGVLGRLARRPHANHYGGRGARSLLVEIPADHRAAAELREIEQIAADDAAILRAAGRLVRAFRCGTDRAAEIRASTRLLLASIAGTRKPAPPAWLDAVREQVGERWVGPLVLSGVAHLPGLPPGSLSP